jgi:DNA-binding transcriptional LysR family regulator
VVPGVPRGENKYRMEMLDRPHITPKRRLERCCDLELRQLRAFVALIDEGGVTAAARALRLAQSTVSEALAALERGLGTSVVQRRRGSQDSLLTPAGQALLPYAREVLAAVEKAFIAVAEAAVEARGAVNIVANESLSTYVLPKVLAQLRMRWPNTSFNIVVATCTDVQRGIEDGSFDVGLMLQLSGDNAYRLINKSRRAEGHHVLAPLVPLIIFASPTHPLSKSKHHQGLGKGELTEFLMFLSDADGEFHELVESFFLEGSLATVRLQSAGSIEAVKRGVVADPDALGILPEYAIEEEIRAGSLVPLTINPTPPAMQLIALLSRVREHHPGTIELLEDLKEVFWASQPSG